MNLARTATAGILLVALTLLIYLPSLYEQHGDFIWDDNTYIVANPMMRSVQGLGQIWFDFKTATQYYPLVFFTFWLEFQLWGLEPFGYHVVNVLLHAAAAVLVWITLRRLNVPGAWLAAAIFALHPVHAESVAWISERKNVLSGVFYLASLLVYLRFLRMRDAESLEAGKSRTAGPQTRAGASGWYALALLMFICALLSKTVTCSLPAAILLILWWKKGRLTRRDVLPLAPWFIIGVLLAWITTVVEGQHITKHGGDWLPTIPQRLILVGRLLWFYLSKLVLPINLSFLYPRWGIDAHQWWQYVYLMAVIGLLAALWVLRRRLGKGPLVAALFFGGTLLPALGLFFNIHFMRYSFAADHFQYLASIGPIALLAAGLTVLLSPKSEPSRGTATQATVEHRGQRPARNTSSPPYQSKAGVRRAQPATSAVPSIPAAPGLRVTATAILAVLAILTWQQARLYTSRISLWGHTVERNPACSLAQTELGAAYSDQQQFDKALEHYRAAVMCEPTFAVAHHNIGIVLANQGRYAEALEPFDKSIELDAKFGLAHKNKAGALFKLGRLAEAVTEYEKALTLESPTPGNTAYLVDIHRNVGIALARLHRDPEAAEHFRAVVQLTPYSAEARENLGITLASAGKLGEAAEEFRQAARLNPRDPDVHTNLGDALRQLGQLGEAVSEYRQALALNPSHGGAAAGLNAALAAQGAGGTP